MRHCHVSLLIVLAIAAAFVPAVSYAQPADEKSGGERDRPSVDQILDSFPNEPGVRSVQRAALDHAGLRESNAPDWRTRARLANLVPSLGGDVEWEGETDRALEYSEEFGVDDRGEMSRSDANHEFARDERRGRKVAIEAEIELGGVVFDRNEIYAARELRKRRDARRTLLARVTALYFKRRKKQVLQRVTPRNAWEKRLELTLEIRRLTARLDGLTGGWFRRHLDTEGTKEAP